jgi:predicted RNase H-like nuclease (RuvC/YqgF family)
MSEERYVALIRIEGKKGLTEAEVVQDFRDAPLPFRVYTANFIDEPHARRLEERHQGTCDLDKEVERLRSENADLLAKLKAATTQSAAIGLQLQRLAQHKEAIFVPDDKGVQETLRRNQELQEQLQEAQMKVARLEGVLSMERENPELERLRAAQRDTERHNEFLMKVRDENGARIIQQRDRIWELEAGIAPELVALQAERDFWRNKAKELMKK